MISAPPPDRRHEPHGSESRAKEGPSLACRRIVKRFGGLTVLDNIDFSANFGEAVGIIGGNGAGKTTLFNILSGQIRPDDGSVFLNGNEVTTEPVYSRVERGLARTFQTPIVPDGLTVGEVFMVAYSVAREATDAVPPKEAAESVGLEVSFDTRCATLRTLDRRLLLLASLLMRSPRVIALDEPFAGLEGGEIERFADTIRGLSLATTTVVIIEHRLEELFALVGRVVVMDTGRIIFEGDPRDALATPENGGRETHKNLPHHSSQAHE